MRRYAEDTSVPVARSRAEIERLLRDWRCDGIRWSDIYSKGQSVLEFVWQRAESEVYMARFEIALPSDDELRERAVDGRSGRFSEAKYGALQAARGKAEHRVLALWLKAALNAIDAGLVAAEAIFLPWLVGRDGKTVAETALPRLQKLLAGGADRLLLADGREQA